MSRNNEKKSELDAVVRALKTGNFESLRPELDHIDPDGQDLPSEALDDILDLALQKAAFEEFLGLAQSPLFDNESVYRALNRAAGELSREKIFQAFKALGPPDREYAPALLEVLIADPDQAVTDLLADFIAGLAEKEAESGISFSAHSRSMASFRAIRWAPEDGGLSQALSILGRREDEKAQALLRGYLDRLPWGGDRQATVMLLSAVVNRPDAANRAALERALEKYDQPGPLRLFLLGAWSVFNHNHALKTAMRDLTRPMDRTDLFDHLEWLAGSLEEAGAKEGFQLDRTGLTREAASLDPENWPSLARGYLAEILKKHLPEALPAARAGPWERFQVRLVGAFMNWRLDHMGCVLTLPLLGAAAYGLTLALNWALIRPPSPWAYLDLGLVVLWLLILGGTSSTHFSGNETPETRLKMASLFWGAALAVPLTMIGLRLYLLAGT